MTPRKKISQAAHVRAIAARVDVASRELARSATPWRARVDRHCAAIIVIGGLAGGIAATALPRRWWARLGSMVGAVAMGAARSALLPVLLGANRNQPDAVQPAPNNP